MKIGTLVRHRVIKNTRQVGIITELRNRPGYFEGYNKKFKVQWGDIAVQEYWYLEEDLEVLCK